MRDASRAGGSRHRPTLEQVAARAGFSRATVSRVVNGSTTVDPAIRKTVMQAVQELGYVPNPAARSLVTQRTNSVALVMPALVALTWGLEVADGAGLLVGREAGPVVLAVDDDEAVGEAGAP